MVGRFTGRLKNKRGNISIFVVIVFTCFLTVSAVLFAAAKSVTNRSMTDASLQLAGRSVLAEYDRRLLSDYGLLAFRGDEGWVEDAIVYYTEASIAPRNPLYLAFRGGGERIIAQDARCEDVVVSLAGYSLLDLESFESQLREAVITELVGSLLPSQGRVGGSAEGRTERDDGYGRVLRDKGVISSLPSTGFKGPLFPSFGDITDIPAYGNVMNAGASLFSVTEYAIAIFGNHVDGSVKDHFFGNEIEYLIAGYHDDSANYNNIKHRLRAMRYVANNFALAADSKKMEKVEEIAFLISLINGESHFEQIKVAVMQAWVAAETGNDLMLLERGDKVALLKAPSQWATQNIEEIWNGWTSSEPSYPSDRNGQSYRDYLRIMLYVLDRETKLLRIMDLMQINLKGTYYREFLMREHYTGFRFECLVDGEHYAYTEIY